MDQVWNLTDIRHLSFPSHTTCAKLKFSLGFLACTPTSSIYLTGIFKTSFKTWDRGRHGRDCMIVGFTTTCVISANNPITTKSVSSNPAHGEVCTIQIDVLKFVSDLRQVGGFLVYSCFLHQ